MSWNISSALLFTRLENIICYNMLSMVLLTLTMFVSGFAVVPETLSEPDKNAFLSAHNKLRSALNLTRLVWNSTLASVAERHGSGCLLELSLSDFGENLYALYPKKTDNAQIAYGAIKFWAAEVKNVDPAWACIIDSESSCRHYSQLVWSNTTSVGCSIVHCDGTLANFVVCEYNTRGNEYGQNPY